MSAMFLLWICFNGRASLDVIGVGLVVCFALTFLLRKTIGYTFMGEVRVILAVPEILRYALTLVIEVVKANAAVIRVILSSGSRIQSQLTFFTPKTNLNTDFSRVILANSITLTPGTITVQLKNDRYCVHTIRDEYIEGINECSFAKGAARLEAKIHK